jgi:broad specificity phosphatase PhoE
MILFLQHGKTVSSEQGLIAGPDEGLAESGREDASKAGRHLAILLGGRTLHEVLISPAQRTRETGALALGTGLFGFDREPRDEERLAPRGVTPDMIGTRADAVPWDDEPALEVLGVETSAALTARHAALWDELTSGGPDRNILLVGHSSSMPVFAKLAGLSLDAAAVARDEVMVLRS